MRSDISLKENQMPLWQKDLNADRALGLFIPIFAGLCGITREPADFLRLLVVSSCTALIVASIGFALYFSYSKKDIAKNYEYRMNRIARGWKSRIDNNLRVFTVFGVSVATVFFVIFSLFGLALYSYWQFLFATLVVCYIYGLFFTVTTALLDFCAQKQANS